MLQPLAGLQVLTVFIFLVIIVLVHALGCLHGQLFILLQIVVSTDAPEVIELVDGGRSRLGRHVGNMQGVHRYTPWLLHKALSRLLAQHPIQLPELDACQDVLRLILDQLVQERDCFLHVVARLAYPQLSLQMSLVARLAQGISRSGCVLRLVLFGLAAFLKITWMIDENAVEVCVVEGVL